MPVCGVERDGSMVVTLVGEISGRLALIMGEEVLLGKLSRGWLGRCAAQEEQFVSFRLSWRCVSCPEAFTSGRHTAITTIETRIQGSRSPGCTNHSAPKTSRHRPCDIFSPIRWTSTGLNGGVPQEIHCTEFLLPLPDRSVVHLYPLPTT